MVKKTMGNNRNSTELKQITFAPIVKEEIKLKREFKMPTIANKYDIKTVQKIHKATFQIVDVLIDKLKDGFQITDALSAFSLFSPIKDIGANWKQAALEYGDLNEQESSQLLYEVGEEILHTAGIDPYDIGTRNIDHLMFVLKLIGDMYDLIAEKLKDGYQPEDLDKLPEFTEILVKILGKINEAALDASDLQGIEYVEMGKYLTLRIHRALRA